MNLHLRIAAGLLPAFAPAQSPPAPGTAPAETQPAPAPAPQARFIQLVFPRDAQRVVAKVDGQPITLEELVRHIDERHYPGFREFLLGPEGKGSPDGKRMLQSDLIAPWVRQYADVVALRAEARVRRQMEEDAIKQAQDKALENAFKVYFDDYAAGLRSRGLPTEIGQDRFHRLLSDYQLRNGLACELQGWLDYLAPLRDWSHQELRDFFQDNARIFGGAVTIAHILVQNRDAGTGILLTGDARDRAVARLQAIETRLRPDGSNFEELARLYSEDTRTAADGGVLANVERFDYRLPAAICRTAWYLQDGKVSDVVETQYGWHLVKRIELVQKQIMLFTDGALPTVRETRRRFDQENLLFDVRKRYHVELLL